MTALLFLHGTALRRALEAFNGSWAMRAISACIIALLARHAILAVVRPIRFGTAIPLAVVIAFAAVTCVAFGIALVIVKAFGGPSGLRTMDEALLRLGGLPGRAWLFAAQLSQVRRALAVIVLFACFGGLVGKALPWSIELLAFCGWILASALLPLVRVALRIGAESTSMLRLIAIVFSASVAAALVAAAVWRAAGNTVVDAVAVVAIGIFAGSTIVIVAHRLPVSLDVFSAREGWLTQKNAFGSRRLKLLATTKPSRVFSGAAAPLFVMFRSMQLSPVRIVARVAIGLVVVAATVIPALLMPIDAADRSRYVACAALSSAFVATYSARSVTKHVGHPVWRIACGTTSAHIMMTVVASLFDLYIIGVITNLALALVLRDPMSLIFVPLTIVAVTSGRLLAVALDWRMPHPRELTALIRAIQVCMSLVLLACVFAPFLSAGAEIVSSCIETFLLLAAIGVASSIAALRAPWRSTSAENLVESA